MSYRSIKTDDYTEKLLYDLMNFYNILPHLQNAVDFNAWERWFEKLYLVNKRALIIHLREHCKDYPNDWIDFAEEYMEVWIRKG